MGGMTCGFVGDTLEDILEQVKRATLDAVRIPLWPETELVVFGPDYDPDNPKKDAVKIFKVSLIDEDAGFDLDTFCDVSFTQVEKGRIWHVSLIKEKLGGFEPNKWTASISFRK